MDLYTEKTEEFNDSQADVDLQSQYISQPLDIFNTALESQDLEVKNTRMLVESMDSKVTKLEKKWNQIGGK